MHDLPIFPLAIVLLPGASIPLHVFEPRYRQMVAHCLEADKRFGLVYHDPDDSGPFRVEGQIGCVAEIREFQPIPDGRSMILVEGRERVRLEEEQDADSMYYRALAAVYEDTDPEPEGILERRRESISLFRRTVGKITDTAKQIPPVTEEHDASFQLARWIHTAPQWHQRLLESRSEVERLEQIDTLLYDALEDLD